VIAANSLLARLTAEWNRLTARPSAVRQANGWRLGIELHTLDDVIVATGYAAAPGVVAPARANDVLARLLIAARTDDLAARVVLQRIIPGLCARARRWQSMHRGDWLAAFDDLVSAAWPVIRSFPVERRPTHLAANLLRDAEHVAYRKAARRVWATEAVEPRLLDVPHDLPDPEPLVELLQVVAMSRAMLADDELQLMRLLLSGHAPDAVAGELGVSERTVRTRKASLVAVLRRCLAGDEVSVPAGIGAAAGCC